MDDNAGVVGKVLAVNGPSATTSNVDIGTTRRWIEVPIGFYATAGTYWIAFSSTYNTGTSSIAYVWSGADAKTTAQAKIYDASQLAPTVGSNKYSIRASFLGPL